MGTYSKLIQGEPLPVKKEDSKGIAEPVPQKPVATPPTEDVATGELATKDVAPEVKVTKDAATKDAGPKVGVKENLQESKLASLQANKHASKLPRPHVDLHGHMRALLEEKAAYSFTFRYPPGLLDLLGDTVHHIKKQHRVKLTKNAIAVVAIVFLLSDYETYGEESVLFQMLIEPPAD